MSTNYINFHPGGSNAIISYCGRDATAVFTGLPHSAGAANLLADYYIGDVGQPFLIPAPTVAPSPKAQPKPKPPRWDDDDD